MSSSGDLRLAWCSFEAAQFACRRWHYSRSLPAGKLAKIGVWEANAFAGCTLFGRGAARHIGRPFQLRQDEVCELTRVALGPHFTATSRIVAIALRMLRRQSPGLKLVVSYADPAQGHIGVIYQAGGWLYLGPTHRECLLRVHDRLVHPRTVGSRFGHRGIQWLQQHIDPSAERVVVPAKHKYVYPFDEALRAQLRPLVRPYPKLERERSAEIGTAVPTARGGEIPTRSLHDSARAADA